jgi:ParB/RepB/Spo0J family partition protein
MPVEKVFPENLDKIVEVPLSQITADSKWNSRSGDWQTPDGDETGQQFIDLVSSIEENGQQDPVRLCLVDDPEKPYHLEAGFRRFKAVQKIAEVKGIENPTIRAIVARHNDVDARITNLTENVTRAAITPPDLAWGITELDKEAKKAGTPLTAVKMASILGKDQTYVSKLLKIGQCLKADLFRRWRGEAVSVSVNHVLEVAKLPKDEQTAAFNALVRIEDVDGESTETAARAWIDTAKKKAADIAVLLGNLERLQLISTTPLDFDTHLDLLIKLNRKATANNKKSIAAVARKAYEGALNFVEPEEEDEDESEDEKPRRRPKD